MKRYVRNKIDVETTTEIGNVVGFETTDNRKGTLVYTGETNVLHAIVCDGEGFGVPNSSCGTVDQNKYKSVEDFINRHASVFEESGISICIKDFYFFDNAKNLYGWLSK